MGASFEVETAPVLARPIDGVGKGREAVTSDMDLPPLANADEVHGNLVIMTDAAGLSGVASACEAPAFAPLISRVLTSRSYSLC